MQATGKFVKVFVKGMKKHGQYRGVGSLQVTDTGIAVTGKHVYSLGARWLFAIAIALACLILTAGALAPGILLLYPIVEYLWLAKGDQTIPFDRVVAYSAHPAKTIVAVEFEGTPWESPIVLKTPEWESVYNSLSQHIPEKRVS